MGVMNQQLFVSHATKDDETVSRLCTDLDATAGCKFWVDHHHLKPPEDNWRGAIQDALQTAGAGLLVLSRNSVSRPEIVAEWTYLLNLGRGLFVAKIDDVPIEDIDYRLHLVQWIDLSQDWEAGVKALVAAIQGEPVANDAPVRVVRHVTGHIDRKLRAIPISGRGYGLSVVQSRLKCGPTMILGIGGIGKSRVAAEVVMTSPEYQGAVWHSCSDVSRSEDVLHLIRQHCELPPDTPRHHTLAALKNALCLVVIDNAETVIDENRPDYVRLIEDLYEAGAQVLLTSRIEWEELAISETYRPQRLGKSNAEQLLRDMEVAFNSPHNLGRYAKRMANAARYHPGLIEWAVRQTKRFPPERVINHLRRLRSRKMQAALDEMLHKTVRQMTRRDGKEARDALRRIVVFRGGFTVEALQAVLGGDGDWVDHSLDVLLTWQFIRLIVIKGQTRYWVDPLVIECIEADEATRPLHFTYYKTLAERQHELGDYRPLVPEIANLEVARSWNEAFAIWLDTIWPQITAAKMR